MKLNFTPSTVLAVVGITLAGAFVLIAIISPKSLDWILHPSEEISDSIKKEMERQKGIDARGRSDAQSKHEDEVKSDAATPTPLPEETVQAPEEERRGDGRIRPPECISRNQVVNILSSSEESRDGRVIGISVTPDGRRVKVLYRKKTFLGIGSGQNQIGAILQRGLRNRFPDRLIKSLQVHSDGRYSTQQDGKNVDVEVLSIEILQAGCR